jgi:uncharacterized protein with HEPN domain
MPPDANEPAAADRQPVLIAGRDAALLLDMLDAARIVAGYVAGRSFDDYARDRMLRDAVERRIEIIGEAARGVSEAVRVASPQVPWRAIMAQRNILAHEYATVRNDLIWTVATVHVPAFIGVLEPLIPPPPADP